MEVVQCFCCRVEMILHVEYKHVESFHSRSKNVNCELNGYIIIYLVPAVSATTVTMERKYCIYVVNLWSIKATAIIPSQFLPSRNIDSCKECYVKQPYVTVVNPHWNIYKICIFTPIENTCTHILKLIYKYKSHFFK